MRVITQSTMILALLAGLILLLLVPSTTAATLSATTLETTDDHAGATTTVHFNFTISTVNNTHWMNVTFPSGFNITGATPDCDQATGETKVITGQALNISKIVDTNGTNVAIKCAISGIKNPTTAASGGTTSSQFKATIRNATTTEVNNADIGTLITHPDVPAAGNSTVSVASSTITSGGSTTVTVVLKDQFGNTNGTVQTVEWDQGNGTWASMTSAGSGSYTATFNNNTAGTYTIKARFTSPSTTTITDTASVTVNAASSSSNDGIKTDKGSGSPATTSSGTGSGTEAQVSNHDSTEHELEYSGERGIQTIEVTMVESGPVAFQTTTMDQPATDLPSGFKSTAFWIDIKQTKGGAVDAASVTLGPFDPVHFDDDPESFVVFHGTDAGWEELPTTVTINSDGTFTVTFTTDSFSPFVIASALTAPDTGRGFEEASDDAVEAGPEDDAMENGSEATPGFGLLATMVMLALAAIVIRRRNH